MSLSVTFSVSDLEQLRYGQYLSADEVHELLKPSNDTLDLVHNWLFEHDIDASQLEYSPAQDWIKVTLPVETVERILDT